MNRLERAIVEAMRAEPDGAHPGGLFALRRAIGGCDMTELKAAVQRMRWAGRISMDKLQLSPSMMDEIGRGARDGRPLTPVAEGAGGDTTASTAPEVMDRAGSTCPADGEREKGVPAPETAEEEEEPVTLAAPPSSPLRRQSPAQPFRARHAAAPVPLIGAKAAPYQAPQRASWIEQHLARRDAARAFLVSKGRHPWRCDAGGSPKWAVPGWSGSYTDHDLIAIAQQYGFERETANG